jgi:hypothetical protein
VKNVQTQISTQCLEHCSRNSARPMHLDSMRPLETRHLFPLFHHSPFTGANDEKSGLVWAVPRVANGPAFLPGAIISRPSGALFWHLREGLDSQKWGERLKIIRGDISAKTVTAENAENAKSGSHFAAIILLEPL